MKVMIRVAAALIFLCSVLACHGQPTASADKIPPEDWSYDALMHLAAQGLTPGVPAQRFMGDWIYNREEMAEFVRLAWSTVDESTREQDRALISRLAAEFAPELQSTGTSLDVIESIEPFREARVLAPAASFQPRVVRSDGETHLVGIYDASAIGTSGRYITAVGTLSDTRRKFDGDEFSRLQKLFVRGKTPNWEWEIGKDFLWWGPGYSGSLILSDNSPGFTIFKLGKDFNFGRRIGHIKITQFGTTFEDDGERFYLLGRRFEKRFSKRFNLGISETAKMSERPNPLILIFPSFYLYQRAFIDDVDFEFNSLISLDALYRFSPRFEAYGDYLIDDRTAPALLREGPAWNLPRKVGYLIGGHWPDVLGDGSTSLRVERIVIDVGTYQATRPNFPGLAYTHDGLVIGHPVGSNSEAVFFRVDRKFGKEWRAVAEVLDRRPRVADGPNPDDARRISLLAVRDLSPCASLTFRYDSLRLPEKENRVHFGASLAF